MERIDISFDIYDARYRTEPDRSTCFEAGCETLNEAKESAIEYGNGCVIVRSVSKKTSQGLWEEMESEIVN